MKKGRASESTIIIGPSVCSGLRAPQLIIRRRPCPISGVRAKIIIIFKEVCNKDLTTLNLICGLFD